MIKPGTYPYQGGEYSLHNNRNKKRWIQNKKGDKINLEKQKDGDFILESNNNNLILIQDREHFHILDTDNPSLNPTKIHNFGIEIDTELIADFIREIDSIKKYCGSRIYTREPLREPSDIYIFIDIFSDRKIEKETRSALGSVRIFNKFNEDDNILYTINELIIDDLQNISSDNIIQIKTYTDPVLLKYGKSYLVQDYKIIYKKS